MTEYAFKHAAAILKAVAEDLLDEGRRDWNAATQAHRADVFLKPVS
jgi:hypothetical protein